jgi:hypothetical protein
MGDDKKPQSESLQAKHPDVKIEVITSDTDQARKLDSEIKWVVKEYSGVEVLTAPEGHSYEEIVDGTWPDFEPEPITDPEGLTVGRVVLVPSLMGGLSVYQVERATDGDLLLRSGDMLGMVEFAPDDRGCWVCIGVANIKAIQKLNLSGELTEQEKLERAIRNAHRLIESREGQDDQQDAVDIARWLEQLHALRFPPGDEDEQVVDLDGHRVRSEREFEDEQMLYIEVLWGKETFAYDIAIRDIEKMRRGTENPTKPLRPPETDYEIELAIKHIRWFANEVARLSGNEDWVRPEDDTAAGR